MKKKKKGLKGIVNFFSVDFNPIDTNNFLDICTNLTKKTLYKMFELIKKIFIGLLTGIETASNHKNYLLLSNQKCMIQPTLINIHPNEYIQELQPCPFAVKLDSCVGIFRFLIPVLTYLIKYVFQIKQKI